MQCRLECTFNWSENLSERIIVIEEQQKKTVTILKIISAVARQAQRNEKRNPVKGDGSERKILVFFISSNNAMRFVNARVIEKRKSEKANKRFFLFQKNEARKGKEERKGQ